MSPFRTLKSCGSSSILVFLRNFPTGVRRRSFLILRDIIGGKPCDWMTPAQAQERLSDLVGMSRRDLGPRKVTGAEDSGAGGGPRGSLPLLPICDTRDAERRDRKSTRLNSS